MAESENKNPQEELNYIYQMMEFSRTFRGMSAWASIWMGLVAGIAGIVAVQPFVDAIWFPRNMAILGLVTLLLAFTGALFFLNLKAKKDGVDLWTPAFIRIMRNMMTVVLLGGLVVVALMLHRLSQFALATSLLVYGFGLLMLERDTYRGVSVLGVLFAICGVVAFFLPSWSLQLWVLGFSGLHLAYGAVLMVRK